MVLWCEVLRLTGNAVFGKDYTATLGTDADTFGASAGTVKFLVGKATATVVIKPIDNSVIEPNKNVILTVVAGTTNDYEVGSPTSAMVVIIDDDLMTGMP